MGKEKRKGRLDKGTGSTDFIGFGAFAAPTQANSVASVSLSPVYTGKDETLATLFGRISQKRDATTKLKALADLQAYLSKDVPKKTLVEGLSHFGWIYHAKLFYDSQASVRAQALNVWKVATEELPKAVTKLVTGVQDSEILGMIHCQTVDPSAEVRAAGTSVRQVLIITGGEGNGDGTASEQQEQEHWQSGLFALAKRILGYGRASVMQNALFAPPVAADLVETQKDALEERYQRLTALMLDALTAWITEHPDMPMEDGSEAARTWFQSLSSPVAPVRQRTYRLLGAVATHQPTALTTVCNRVPQVLSSEKDATNWPVLLETVLALAASGSIDATAVIKPLGKVLKRACLGSPVSEWGPTLLPLTAMWPNHAAPLLQAAWEGRAVALEAWRLPAAVAESAVFSLRKSEPVSQVLVEVWLSTLTVALQERRISVQPWATQVVLLARDRSVADWTAIQDSIRLGIQSVVVTPDTDLEALAGLLAELGGKSDQEALGTLAAMQKRFQQEWESLQTSSGALPKLSTYRFFQSVLDACGPLETLQVSGEEDSSSLSVGRFVVNDVLSWMILHSSALSEQANEVMWTFDCQILRTILGACEATQAATWWRTIWKELVTAKVLVGYAVVGLRIFLQEPSSKAWLACQSLDDWCRGLSREQGDEVHDGTLPDHTSRWYRERLELFRLCLGLDPPNRSDWIDGSVVDDWVQDMIQLSDKVLAVPPVLEALLQRILHGIEDSSLKPEQVESLLLAGWRIGCSRCHINYTLRILRDNSSLRRSFVVSASVELRKLLDHVTEVDPLDQLLVAHSWSKRAWHFLQVCQDDSEKGFVSLDSVGLGATNRWQGHGDILFACLVCLFEYLEQASDRLALIERSDDSTELLLKILIELSGGRALPASAEMATGMKDYTGDFVASIGGRTIGENLVSELTESAVRSLTSVLQGVNHDSTFKYVSVLSQLVALQFQGISRAKTQLLKAEDMVEGEELYYVTDPKNQKVLEAAKIVKVHYDAQAGYYFSIQVERDGETQERQTVLDRLRREPSVDLKGGVTLDSVSAAELRRRSSIRESIMDKLVRPLGSASPAATVALAEVIPIVVAQIGLTKERGLGSTHYEIFRIISGLEEQVCHALAEKNMASAGDGLWVLSQALGYGWNLESTEWIVRELKVDPSKCSERILELYDDDSVSQDVACDLAVLAWLSTITHAERNEASVAIVANELALLFRLAGRVLGGEQSSDFTVGAAIAIRALHEGLLLSSGPLRSSLNDANVDRMQSEVLVHAVAQFATGWNNVSLCFRLDDGSITQPLEPEWSFSRFGAVVGLLRETESARQSLVAARTNDTLGHLAKALYNEHKSHTAMVLLDATLNSTDQLQSSDGDVILHEKSKEQLKSWTETLDEAEAAELEEDVYIVAEWVPLEMMRDIESWATEEEDDQDDDSSVGRFLTWLLVLNLIDMAAPKDFRNRPAFVSYLGKCDAVRIILDLAMTHDETLHDKKKTAPTVMSMDELLTDRTSLEVSKLASLVFFRTVETLPSLSRRWWEEDCPRQYTSAVQSFVEKHVAPPMLQRELDRILLDTSVFGEMNVRGSLQSREVTASYVQDDFTLRVLIRLPSAFPFQPAVVDCSKTLGVPQQRWKRWSLQITLMLSQQGGTIRDALMLWKGNVDQEFDGVEPCPVCYSVLHVKTHKLPALECKTCQNRFHVDCLTQWFKQSGKSQCVLCQQPWQGRRIQ